MFHIYPQVLLYILLICGVDIEVYHITILDRERLECVHEGGETGGRILMP